MKNQIRGIGHDFINNFSWDRAVIASYCQLISWVILKVNDIFNPLVWVLLGFYLLDCFSRISVERKKGTCSSQKLREKFSKKVKDQWYIILPFILLSWYDHRFSVVVIFLYWYYIFGELSSILENIEEGGGSVPCIISKGVEAGQEALEQGKIPNIAELIQNREIKEEKKSD